MGRDAGSGGGILAAFVLGAIVGAAVGVLFAPDAGDETRRRLAQKARSGRERAEALARDGGEFLKRQRENLGATLERGRDAFEQVRKETL